MDGWLWEAGNLFTSKSESRTRNKKWIDRNKCLKGYWSRRYGHTNKEDLIENRIAKGIAWIKSCIIQIKARLSQGNVRWIGFLEEHLHREHEGRN